MLTKSEVRLENESYLDIFSDSIHSYRSVMCIRIIIIVFTGNEKNDNKLKK